MTTVSGDDAAFPRIESIDKPDTYGPGSVAYRECGLTKRELFAAMAMQGLVSNHAFTAAVEKERGQLTALRFTAQAGVEVADALLAELAK